MIKKIKKGLLVATTFAIMSCNGIVAMASDNAVDSNTTESHIIVDESQVVGEEDTTVGVHDGKVMLNDKNFPDASFREYLESYVDEDGYISTYEVVSIYITGSEDLKSLQGIEYFTELMYLSVEKCPITELDISKNTNLVRLSCQYTDITKIDLSNNVMLNNISFANSKLEELDISSLTELDYLYCENTNLTKLDISKNPGLLLLDCSGVDINKVIFGDNCGLYYLTCIDSNMSTFDFSKLPNLSEVACYDNPIKKLDFSENQYKVNVYYDYDIVDEIIFASSNAGGLFAMSDYSDGKFDLSNVKGYDFSVITDEKYDATTGIVTIKPEDTSKPAEHMLLLAGYNCYYVSTNNYSNMIIVCFKEYGETKPVNVSYHTHIQNYGDSQGTKTNGEMAGTMGESKRLENIWIDIDGNDNLGIQYTTHCQNYGWMPWSSDGDVNGTSGESKRMEAIKIQLTGSDVSKYDVYYRVHAQSYGWLGWAKNGEPAGTAGYSKRLEGIQVVVLPKNSEAPGVMYAEVEGSATNDAYYSKDGDVPTVSGAEIVNVKYRTHVQTYGWQGFKYNGVMAGTTGESKRLEGIEIALTNQKYSGDIVYITHVQTYGWQGEPDDETRAGWMKNGEMSGTSGESKRLEAICIDLTGDMGDKYDVYYRVHAQNYGWLGWAKNGEASGTAGYSKRLEGIQIVLVEKGGAAPANNYGGITSDQDEAYIEK